MSNQLCNKSKIVDYQKRIEMKEEVTCPAQQLLSLLSGKWKPQIFRLATQGPVRFNALLRQIPLSNKQSLATALREMDEAHLLTKIVVKEKPLHIEYHLTNKGKDLIPIFIQLEQLNQ